MSRILSGIRASGQLHIGHYLGAIKQWIELQDEHEVLYMVADLHGITTPYDPKELPGMVRETVIDYLAAGLDPKKATIFVQSFVPAHSQLMWLLNTITPLGELQRMVQFKEWTEKYSHVLTAGILNYPILQAADILLYKPALVPVGEDQIQHVELTTDLVKKFNRLYGQTFPEVKPLIVSGTKRIMALDDPERKMSKSENNGIGLNDGPDVILKKVQKAVTSSEPKVIRDAMHAAKASEAGRGEDWRGDANLVKQFHGVRNLFTLLFALADKADREKWQGAAEDGTLQFSQFKPALATIIADHFAPYREKRQQLEKDSDYVDGVLEAGNKKASALADATLLEVQAKMGLRP